MKKKNLMVLTVIMLSGSLIGCGNIAEDVLAENVENTQVESIETIQTENMNVESSDINESATDVQDVTYKEKENLYLLENVVHNPENNIDMDELKPDGSSYKLVKSVNIYDTDNTLAGYTKEDFQMHVVTSNAEWSYCDFGPRTENYLVKTEELFNAISDKDKELLLAASATPTPAPVPTAEPSVAEISVTETPKVETPKEASTPTVSEPVVDIPVVAPPIEEQPVVVEPIIEQPVVVENDKYTPEEVIAIYRSVMESNGITWDPSIKEFASWGSGFMYLDKGWIEENAYSSVEAFQFGGGTGTPWTLYYLEVTGSDENCVYITGWHCTN